jgi:ribosomal protein S18 acetylase RimI-like enzyme
MTGTSQRLPTQDVQDALANPIWAALTGPHAHLAERVGRAARYPVDVSPFAGLADQHDPAAWADLATLIGPGGFTALAGLRVAPPPGWTEQWRGPGVQLVAETVTGRAEPAAVELGPDDVPDMLDLVERTQPGPFLPRTVELGRYLGIRRAGALVAMAGERLHGTGWTEISAVCTDPAHRGEGLATRLVLAVAAGIQQRGELPIMHAAAANTSAIRLYLSLGFVLRGEPAFAALRPPA